MFFGEVRVDEAEGLILGHSLRLSSLMLKKGHVLDAADVQRLKAAGINFVTGARLEAGDVGENPAASLLASVLAGQGVDASPAFAGRCNLFAAQAGLLVYDRERLDHVNMLDEAITVAAADAYTILHPGQLLGTIKIIPFGIHQRLVEACQAMTQRGGPLFSVRSFQPTPVGLILTILPGIKDSTLSTVIDITRQRLEALNAHISSTVRCPHEIGPIERALGKILATGCRMVLIIGASATVDRRDVVPQALVRAGGQIDHFGMPVDPGNLLLLGRLGAVPVVNLPGCARSPKPNGLDWVLRRLMAGLTIKPTDMMRMGAGGLLKQNRPQPRLYPRPALSRECRIAALVLAEKTPPFALLELALAAGLEPVTVAIPPAADPLEEQLPACECIIARAQHSDTSHLLACGLAVLPPDCDGVVIMPSDCRDLSVEALHAMVKAFDPDEGRAVILPHSDACCALVAADYLPSLARHGLAETAREHSDVVFLLGR